MSIYGKSGNQLASAYALDGQSAEIAYDVNGVKVFPSLVVMTYNLQRWEGYNSLKSIQNIAFNYGADIVGIQEWGTTASKTIEGTNCVTYLNGFGYDDVSVTTLDYNHKAVATKIPMSNETEIVFAESIETRSYTKAYFTFGGKTIAFFNTHTDYQLNSPVKFAQIEELVEAVSQEEYFILTGDLNTTAYSKTDTEYINGTQKFIDAGFNVANSPVGDSLIWTAYSGKTVATSTSITCADNIITSSNIFISNAHTIDTKLTAGLDYVIDHIPLVATIVIGESA